MSISQVVSSPTMQVSIRTGGACGRKVGMGLITKFGLFIIGWLMGSSKKLFPPGADDDP